MQCRQLGTVLGLLEVGRVGLLNLFLRLLGRIDLRARDESVAATRPQSERFEDVEAVANRHRCHVEVAVGGIDLGPLDVHDGLTVDVAERVEGGARTECDIRNSDHCSDDSQHDDGCECGQERHYPSIHLIQSKARRLRSTDRTA